LRFKYYIYAPESEILHEQTKFFVQHLPEYENSFFNNLEILFTDLRQI